MGDFNQAMVSPAAFNPSLAGEQKKRGGLDFKVYQELKTGIHRDLLAKVDIEKVATVRDDRTRRQVFSVIQDIILDLKTPMSGSVQELLFCAVFVVVFRVCTSITVLD